MRQSIFRAITTAKKNIKKHHKELFEHLDKFITTGTYNSYSQDTPVSWVQDQ
jgi:predicted metal-dependent hydrolase